MKQFLILILLVCVTLPAYAGTLYIGTSEKVELVQLLRAWKSIQVFTDAGVDFTDPAIQPVLEPGMLDRALTAQARIDGLITITVFPDAALLAEKWAEGIGVVKFNIGAAIDCTDFTTAVARVVQVCDVVGAESISVRVGDKRLMRCQSIGEFHTWGVETCE